MVKAKDTITKSTKKRIVIVHLVSLVIKSPKQEQRNSVGLTTAICSQGVSESYVDKRKMRVVILHYAKLTPVGLKSIISQTRHSPKNCKCHHN